MEGHLGLVPSKVSQGELAEVSKVSELRPRIGLASPQWA